MIKGNGNGKRIVKVCKKSYVLFDWIHKFKYLNIVDKRLSSNTNEQLCYGKDKLIKHCYVSSNDLIKSHFWMLLLFTIYSLCPFKFKCGSLYFICLLRLNSRIYFSIIYLLSFKSMHLLSNIYSLSFNITHLLFCHFFASI